MLIRSLIRHACILFLRQTHFLTNFLFLLLDGLLDFFIFFDGIVKKFVLKSSAFPFLYMFDVIFMPIVFIVICLCSGARNVQTRLVEPSVASMNSGDVFILVTPKLVHQWNGKFCSIMEKARVCTAIDNFNLLSSKVEVQAIFSPLSTLKFFSFLS